MSNPEISAAILGRTAGDLFSAKPTVTHPHTNEIKNEEAENCQGALPTMLNARLNEKVRALTQAIRDFLSDFNVVGGAVCVEPDLPLLPRFPLRGLLPTGIF